MKQIKNLEDAHQIMAKYEDYAGGDFIEAMNALEDFFLTDEQKAAMRDAEYKYALQIGIDPVFAKYYYAHE